MDKELKQRVMNMENTIWNSLFWSCTLPEIMSWGISKKKALIYENMLALELKVNGMVHKGSVVIAYDEGPDSFIVYLLENNRTVVKTLEDVYVDELGSIIDENIERPKNVTDTQYRSKIFVELINA